MRPREPSPVDRVPQAVHVDTVSFGQIRDLHHGIGQVNSVSHVGEHFEVWHHIGLQVTLEVEVESDCCAMGLKPQLLDTVDRLLYAGVQTAEAGEAERDCDSCLQSPSECVIGISRVEGAVFDLAENCATLLQQKVVLAADLLLQQLENRVFMANQLAELVLLMLPVEVQWHTNGDALLFDDIGFRGRGVNRGAVAQQLHRDRTVGLVV